MTQIYDETGAVIPVTEIRILPAVVVGKRSVARDGYDALVLGFEPAREKDLSRPQRGQFPEGVPPRKILREVKVDTESFVIGQEIRGTNFSAGTHVDITGISKGRGFQGVVKRHHFGGGAESHGSNFHRAPGSIGGSSDPSRVFPGTRMGGRMGGVRRTVQNLRVVRAIPEESLLLVRGAVPGPTGSLVTVRAARRSHMPQVSKTPAKAGAK
jgi:large subunit ribosomal protein L3